MFNAGREAYEQRKQLQELTDNLRLRADIDYLAIMTGGGGMSWFERVKIYYDKGLWSKERVYNVVGKVITAEEYEEDYREEPYIA